MIALTRIALICTVLGCTAAACSPATTGTTATTTLRARDFFPLHTQAAWSYDSREVDETGTPLPGGENSLMIQRVERDDGAGGFYLRNGRTVSLYEYGEGGVLRNGSLVLSGPIEKGTQWEGRTGDIFTIERIDLTREVPAGKFEHVVEISHTIVGSLPGATMRLREHYYYALNVGLVEAVIPVVTRDQTRWFRLQLRGYTLDGQI